MTDVSRAEPDGTVEEPIGGIVSMRCPMCGGDMEPKGYTGLVEDGGPGRYVMSLFWCRHCKNVELG